jgi:MFS family permease
MPDPTGAATATEEPPVSQFTLVARARFAPLFITQSLGALNDNVYKQALVILITFGAAAHSGKDSAMLVTLSTGLFILPFFLFSALAGQLADQLDKARLIQRVKLAEIVIMALGAVGFALSSLPLLICTLFLMGSQSAFFGPLKYGILPQHLHPEELVGGNGLIQMATYVAILVGSIIGGFVMADLDSGPSAVSGIVLVLALCGWLASRFIPAAPPAEPGLTLDFNLWRATRACVGYASENATVLAAVLGISWFWFVGATFFQLLPTYARDVLGGDARVVTLLLAAFSVGIGVGSLLCERLAGGAGALRLLPAGVVGLSVFALVPLALQSSLASAAEAAGTLGMADVLATPASLLVVVAFLLLALAGGLYVVPLYALMQARSDPARRSRVIAANNVINALLMVGSALFTIALLAADLDIAQIFAIVSVLNLGAGIWVIRHTHARAG